MIKSHLSLLASTLFRFMDAAMTSGNWATSDLFTSAEVVIA